MPEPSEQELSSIATFLEPHFGLGFRALDLDEAETTAIGTLLQYVAEQFPKMRYILGLTLDFCLLAQQLSLHDAEAKAPRPGLTDEQLFARYVLVTERGGRAANTLSLTYGTNTVGIRKIEESVVDLFGSLNRPGYPSAYVYNTGQWQKYRESLLVPCFRLSESARHELARRLILFGLANLTENRFFGRDAPRVRLFDLILASYPRASPQENSGAAFQAMVYGYFNADRPHLSLIVDKTRTGSAKQRRFGDIDGYYGLDLELSVEAKDTALSAANVVTELGEFMGNVKSARVQGIAVAAGIEKEAADIMKESGVLPLPLSALSFAVSRWDWRKQDAAVQGMLHYLAHVEQNPDAVARLLGFVHAHDATHDSLNFFRRPGPDQSKAAGPQ